MAIEKHRTSKEVQRRIVSFLVYGGATAGTYNWVTYALNPEQMYGSRALLYTALVGSMVVGVGCVLSAFKIRLGVMAGSVGICLSWVYFAPFSLLLPWREFRWLFTIDLPWIITGHLVDLSKLAAILFLVIATLYSIKQRAVWSRPSEF